MLDGALRWFSICCVLGLAGLYWFSRSGHASVNYSRSTDVGLYFIRDFKVHDFSKLKRGSYISFCPDESQYVDEVLRRKYLPKGRCKMGSAMMLKRIAGLPGDRYSITDDGVYVNGIKQPMSRPMVRDIKGRAMPHLRAMNKSIKTGELLVMTDGSSKLSYDSRYYGPIKASQIVYRSWPAIVWPTSISAGDH